MDHHLFDRFTREVGTRVSRRAGFAMLGAGLVALRETREAAAACNCGNLTCISGQCWPDVEEAAFLTLINRFRSAKGKRPLKASDKLGRAAELHAQYQAQQRKMTHRGRRGSSLAQRAKDSGYRYSYLGENVAWHSANGSAAKFLRMWKKSKPHRRNMLSGKFTEIGIGRARAGNGNWYWTTDFGAP